MNEFITWLIALAEQDVKAVPVVAHKNVKISKDPGAIAYPAIAVTTTRPVYYNH